ncbi:MAG: TIGR03617 family F420-dependent LLM class oxidoreductase [Frankiaceae bacterium]|nr:TIGR03617 family F420-dependent LLM class oxidoreductase [Frankiaceae bacterium]MBV9872887.1 TIGR03617 family F420-dependent LLM class oxidoreductase [Frankiaceae bacterium]
MLVDTHLGSIETAADDAQHAEELGYDGAFTGEVSSDPFLPLAVAAGTTERMTIGTSIAVAFARSPMTLAYTAHDLQRASGGRFILGLGSQVKPHIVRRFAMPWHQPAAQMRELIHAMRAIWASWQTGEPLAFEGEYYQHTLMPPMFTPTRHQYGDPPIYLAGVGDAMTRVAGEVADGFLCHAFTTARWIEERTLPALAAGCASSGRGRSDLVVKATVFLATGTDEEIATAVAAIRAQLAFYASTPSYRPVLELHGWGDLGPELTTLSKAGRWAELVDLIDDDVVDAFAVIASPADVVEQVRTRYAGVVDRVSFIGSALPADLIAALQNPTTD